MDPDYESALEKRVAELTLAQAKQEARLMAHGRQVRRLLNFLADVGYTCREKLRDIRDDTGHETT